MSFAGRKYFLSAAVLTVAGVAGLLWATLPAQVPAPELKIAETLPPPLPPPPPLKSPVDLFRELLGLSLTERRQFLSNRAPIIQKRLLAKVREYESLKPDERELRLRATELRWYLLP